MSNIINGIGLALGTLLIVALSIAAPVATIAGGIWLYNSLSDNEPTVSQTNKTTYSSDYNTDYEDNGLSDIYKMTPADYTTVAASQCSEDPTLSYAVCKCIYVQLFKVYTVPEVFALDYDISLGGEIPIEAQVITDSCF